LALLGEFHPCFFVIRGDLSGAQFFRFDTLTIPHEEQRVHLLPTVLGDVNVISFHAPDTLPTYCVKHDTLNKNERLNLLKTAEIAKPQKKTTKDEVSKTLLEAGQSLTEFLSHYAGLVPRIENEMEIWHENYISDITPPTPPPEEVLQIPPPTPTPRRLRTMQELRDPTARLVYWNTHESDFGYPLHEDHKAMIPLSPRTALFQPPRSYKINGKRDEPPIAPLSVRISAHRPPTGPTPRPMSEVSSVRKDVVSFGKLRPGVKRVKTIKVQAKAMRPLKFRVDPVPNPMVQIDHPRGMMAPGLPHLLKIELEAARDVNVSEVVRFHTSDFEWMIPLEARVKAETPPIEKGEEPAEEEAAAPETAQSVAVPRIAV
jgi:hypothetical protein